jgi:endonuclease/exonuclease/phosphatase (EEP) superfamily protein YafD
MTNEPDATKSTDPSESGDPNTPKPTWRDRIVAVCDRIGQAGAGLTVLGIAAALFGLLARWLWLGELVASLRLHLAVALLATASLALVGRRWGVVTLALGVALWNAWPTLSLTLANPAPVPGDAHHLRVVVANVLGSNDDPEPLLAWIDVVDPDVVLLVEVTEPFIRAFEARVGEWPYQAHDPQHGPFGMGIASRLPIAAIGLGMDGPGPVPVVDATINTSGGQVRFVGLHTLPPATPRFMRDRDALMRWAVDHTRSASRLIIAGDLNATSSSPAFREMVREGDLVDSRRGFGRQPTWPLAFGSAGIGIDHLLLRGDMVVADRFVGPDIGSDHRPIFVDIAIGGVLMPVSDR